MESWIIPCSPDIYDAEAAFEEYKNIVWHQQCNIKPGDVVYIYITAPVKEIRCKCLVVASDIPIDPSEEDDGYVLDEEFCSKTYRRYMELQLIEEYHEPALGYHILLMNGLSGPIRSQRKTGEQLRKYIEETTGANTNAADME